VGGTRLNDTFLAAYMDPSDGDIHTIRAPVWSSWAANSFENGKGFPATEVLANNTAGSTCSVCPMNQFNRWQYFQRYNPNGSVAQGNCACISGGTVEWRTAF